jgi:hypothetical protein
MSNVPGPAVTIAELQKQLEEAQARISFLTAGAAVYSNPAVSASQSIMRVPGGASGAFPDSPVPGNLAQVAPENAVSTDGETDALAVLALRVGALEKRLDTDYSPNNAGLLSAAYALIDHLYATFGVKKPASNG